MSIKHLESIDSGSNYNFQDKMTYAKNPRSVFSFDHLNTLTLSNAGHVIPIGVQETIPGDDWDISIDALVRVMPQVVPMYSRQRLYIYSFWSRCIDLWSGFDVFMRKGYSGNVIKQIPVLDSSNCKDSSTHKVEVDSFADYMGLPIGADLNETVEGDGKGLLNAKINAMIPFMALRVWRDYFANKNYFINDRIILPDDDSRFRLDDDGNLLSAKDNSKHLYFDIFGTGTSHIRYDSLGNLVFGGFYHDYPSDRFVSALPFTQRGDTPTIEPNITSDWSKLFAQSNINTMDSSNPVAPLALTKDGLVIIRPRASDYNSQMIFTNYVSSSDGPSGPEISHYGIGGYKKSIGSTPDFSSAVNQIGTNSLSYGGNTYLASKVFENGLKFTGLTITLNQIRELAIKQSELEKMARTDGSYREFGLTFFGESSKATRDYRPYYIGGTYKNIAFTEVLQTSGSSIGTTDPSSSSPLGAYAGHGITGITNGRIGHIHCDDFGYIMTFACIMPDIYYSQGIKKMFTRSLQSDMYLPERAKLGLIPILNKELYYQGDNSSEEGKDNYLWAYNNPFDELRYTENEIHGKIADPNNLSFFPYTQSRKFDTLVNWGEGFSKANDVRKDSFFAPSEDAYSAQFKFNMRVVRELPYKPIPAQII